MEGVEAVARRRRPAVEVPILLDRRLLCVCGVEGSWCACAWAGEAGGGAGGGEGTSVERGARRTFMTRVNAAGMCGFARELCAEIACMRASRGAFSCVLRACLCFKSERWPKGE